MNLRLNFILLFFITQLSLIAQVSVVEAVHDSYGMSLVDIHDNPYNGNRLLVYQRDNAPLGGFIELVYMSAEEDTLWTAIPSLIIGGGGTEQLRGVFFGQKD